jgi:hypothetical protein
LELECDSLSALADGKHIGSGQSLGSHIFDLNMISSKKFVILHGVLAMRSKDKLINAIFELYGKG